MSTWAISDLGDNVFFVWYLDILNQNEPNLSLAENASVTFCGPILFLTDVKSLQSDGNWEVEQCFLPF